MRILKKINLILLILLSISTALVKLFGMEAEMIIFRKAGCTDLIIYLFGFLQLIGGLLLLPFKTRRTGAAIMLITFIFATIVLFINTMIPFGIFSILFIVMATWPLVKPVTILNSKF